jgi:tight adherence protein C
VIITLLLGLALTAAAVALLVRAVSASRLRTAETIGRIERYGFVGQGESRVGEGFRGFLDDAAAWLGVLLTERLKLVNEDHLRKQLVAAGMYRTSARMLVGYQLFCAVLFPIAWVWISAVGGISTAVTILGALFAIAAGWALPAFIVKQRADARLYRIDHAMPELIDLLVVMVEAGLSLSAGLQLAADRLQGPLGDELRIVLQEQRMGLTPVQALENMLGRCPTPAVESFIRAMMQGQMLGVSVGQILRSLALEMRKRRRALAEERAQKAPIKILFPLVFLIFPAMFVVILGPAVVSILHALN